jgi:phosphoribosylformylglycinamidine synthase subunit PurQ / glutaminase
MRVAVLRFPGANCDQDGLFALREDLGLQAEYVWHEDTSLVGFDAAFLPGGFTYGDYLRVGAMAGRAPIMDEVHRFAREGRPVIGVCNGFQILCEARILPGALMPNEGEKFICDYVHLAAVNRTSFWTQGVDRVIRIPIAHYEGRYVCDESTLKGLQDGDQIAFRYVKADGAPDNGSNINGSMDAIAGVLNEKGNVLGLMPHPERATKPMLGSTDGLLILRALAAVGAGL